MDRTAAANEIRAHFGDRLIRHSEWGSRFDYERFPSSSQFPNPPKRLVAHYNGASAQIPRMRANVAQHGERGAERIQIRYVDKIHFVDNGWGHGFAYCLGIPGLTGDIYEGRSAWYPHGAHFDDPKKLDFPTYFGYGAKDTGLTEPMRDGWGAVVEMLEVRFGFVVSEGSIKGHKEVQRQRTGCPGSDIMGGLVVPLREGGVIIIPPQSTWPLVLRRGDRHPNVRVLRGMLYALDHLSSTYSGVDERYTWAVDKAVRRFQTSARITVDGVTGPQTRGELYTSIAATV